MPLFVRLSVVPAGKLLPVSNAGVAVEVEPTTTPLLMVTVAFNEEV
jgi:hypothetical protein